MSGAANGNGAKRRAEALKQRLGDDLYARFPRRLIERRMDRPPAGNRNGWRTVETEETRVYFAYIRYSWCFPYCYEYAVQAQDGEMVLGPDREPLPLTQAQVAAMLGMLQPNVSEAVARLVEKKLFRVEGRKVYPLFSPPELTADERANYICTDIIQSEDERANYICTDIIQSEDDPTLPASFVNVFNNLAIPLDTRTGIYKAAVAICEQFNLELSRLRAERKNRLAELCAEASRTHAAEASTHAAEASTRPAEASTRPAEASTRPAPNKERARASDRDRDREEESSSAFASSSSRAEPEPETPTATTPVQKDEEPTNRIHAAYREHDPLADRALARNTWMMAKRLDPEIVPEEVCNLIHRYAPGRKQSFGYVVTCIESKLPLERDEKLVRATTPHAPDDPALLRWRAEQEAALADPKVSEQEKHLIRLCLGLPDAV